MGDFFSSPGTSSESGVDDFQHDLFLPLRDYALKHLSGNQGSVDALTAALMGSTSDKSIGLAKDVWKQGFLDPVVSSFQQNTLPAINSSFSRIGGTLSSRRDKSIADAAGQLTSQASGQFAQMLPTIMNFPLQQTLGQIQGYGALTDAQWMPFKNAAGFATANTRQALQDPGGPGWGLLGSGMQAAGFAYGKGK